MYVMKCGHTANSNRLMPDGTKIPSCVICGCIDIAYECTGTSGLEGRKAICTQHKQGGDCRPVPSSWDLPFFRYRPDKEYDEYYCGCWGWD